MLSRARVHILLLFVLSLGVDKALAGDTYNLGETVTNTTGNYTLTWNGSYEFEPNTLKEYKDGAYVRSRDLSGLTSVSYSSQAEAVYTYEFWYIEDLGDYCEGGTCFPLGTIEEHVGTTTVTVDLPPPPSTPGTPTFTYLSHASINSDKDGSFTVNWTASSGNPTSYELQQRLNSGTWSNVYTGSNTSNARSVEDGTYDYRVRACNVGGCSSYTVYSTVTVIKTPSVPGEIVAPATDSDGSYDVSWGASSGTVTKYTLQENVDSGTFSTIQDNWSLSRPISGNASAIYGYRVRACNSLSCSGWTTTKTV